MAKKSLSSMVIRLVIYLILIALFLAVIYPIFWILITSIKAESEFYVNPAMLPRSIRDITFDNYAMAWKMANIVSFLLNSSLISGVGIIGIMIVSAVGGYGFSRFSFRSSDALFLLFVLSLALPAPSIMVFEYIIFAKMHLLNTFHGIILLYMSFSAFGIVLYRNAFQPLPQEIVDAAIIDGCGELRLFWLLFPIVKPTTATIVIFSFIWLWGDFLWPYLLLQKVGQETMSIGLYTVFVGQYYTGWGALAAGLSIAFGPVIILYSMFQGYFIKGITLGAVK